MPKVPAYTLAWSSAREIYELYQTRDREGLGIVPDTPAWLAWLEQVSSFAFAGKSGHYTARKEARQRGDRYWAAYLAVGGHLAKKYLGKSADLSLARLEYIAGTLRAQSEPSLPLSMALAAVRADGERDNAPRPLLARQDTALPPLLATKLHVPRPRAHLVPRAQLIERLQRGVEQALTLISGPAGFGKTTLLAQWCAQSGMSVAWLSLEAEDNDPTRFLSYLIAALQAVDAEIGTAALELLRTSQPPSPKVVLGVLTNDLAGRNEEFVLVLDDYHIITDESIQHGMTFLVEHLPSHLHLILATRADPLLPLARLRVQGQLSEVRVADLRFGPAEASAFLQDVMGLDLPAEAVLTLESRTDGWIAGLQLAALSLQGRTAIPEFLAAFSGTHRYILDYLSDEVLARQPAAVQAFLLQTSILNRLSGPLCDAVTAQEGSQAMLEALERANLFVIPLDDERSWYRYHHLFAEVLRRHLQQREPALVPQLHRRASIWHEQHELPIEAVQHALAIPDAERAARLIEPIGAYAIERHGQHSTVLGWMKALPDALIRARPFLCVYHAVLLLSTNQLQAAEARLQEAERGLQEKMPAGQAQIIQGYMLTIRASIVRYVGDLPQAISLARQALDLLPEAEGIPRAAALVTTIHAYQLSGDVTSVTEHEVAAAGAFIRTSDHLRATVTSICLLAHLYGLQGRLRQAMATYAQVVQVVPRPEVLQSLVSSRYYYFGLGDLLRERNDLDAAERYLAQGMALVNETLTMELFVVALGYTALARLQQARGRAREALATLDALAQVAEQRHLAPYLVTQVAAIRARLELAQGHLAAAVGWADSSGLSTEDEDLPYPREGMYLALARVHIAQARNDPMAPFLPNVLGLLERLLKEAEAKARMGSVLEILIVRTLALEAQGERTVALSTLERALELAAPEGYMRLFVDEGEPMLALLRQAKARSSVRGYVATLLAAFGEPHAPHLPPASPHPSSLLEPLTEREQEVLRLLLEGASNSEIARRLVLSVNTVKRHVYNLCGKLGVQSRTQAIVRARDLHLL